jgi:AraC-like DNA-binding protein
MLRTRLRHAAERLASSREPITEIALDVGFDDLSNFIRSFHAEFGVAPSRYRIAAGPSSPGRPKNAERSQPAGC